MSKWKSSTVKIIQAFNGLYSDKYGLGSDGKIYKWDVQEGAWEKHWTEKDTP